MTLTQTAMLTKQIILVSIIALVLGISAFVGYNIWHAYYLAHLPPVEEKPDAKFGLLPPPLFPKSNVSSSNFSYSLDTKTGGLPKIGKDPGFEKIIKVYFVTASFATLLSSDRSTALAEKFKITSLPQILNDTKYKFQESDKTLSVDLDTGNFTYKNEATMSAKSALDNDAKLVSDFKQMLSFLAVAKEDILNGRSKVLHEKDYQTVWVSLWPAALDKKPVFTADFNKSQIAAEILGSADNLDNYRSLNFTYYPVDTGTFATYPTKTAEKAFEDLKNGQGVVVVEPAAPQVSITSVSSGYFLPDNYTPYLQPIYIFEGPSFAAYVAAIREDFQIRATPN